MRVIIPLAVQVRKSSKADDKAMRRWYALQTKPHKEYQVEAELAARGIEAYLPSVPAPHSRNPKARSSYFPCYLFAHTDLNAVGLWSLHYLPGARGLVMFGGTPASVDDRFIQTLRTRLAETTLVYAHGDTFQSGDRVVITTGPLADMEAIFDQRLSSAGRVRILIDLLARHTPVELDVSTLRKKDGVPRSGVRSFRYR